jgi:hypothetical protein
LNESLPGRIFISYRRQETAWPARRLYDVLVEHFRAEDVFKDVDNIEPGEDFIERITAAVGSCNVPLALIGPQWLTITDENGQRRLDNPADFVRLEIETALTRKIRVIPILVDEARIPRANELPPTLAPLVRRNAAFGPMPSGRRSELARSSPGTNCCTAVRPSTRSAKSGFVLATWTAPGKLSGRLTS